MGNKHFSYIRSTYIDLLGKALSEVRGVTLRDCYEKLLNDYRQRYEFVNHVHPSPEMEQHFIDSILVAGGEVKKAADEQERSIMKDANMQLDKIEKYFDTHVSIKGIIKATVLIGDVALMQLFICLIFYMLMQMGVIQGSADLSRWLISVPNLVISLLGLTISSYNVICEIISKSKTRH